MPAGATYEPIATSSPSGTTIATFSSLGSYSDIVAIISGIWASGGSDVGVRFNSDTGSNYSTTYISGAGSGALSSRNSSDSYIRLAGSSTGSTTIPGFFRLNLIDYRNATTNKTCFTEVSNDKNGTGSVVRTIGLWRSTSAITSISFTATGGVNFASGSIISLYGITRA